MRHGRSGVQHRITRPIAPRRAHAFVKWGEILHEVPSGSAIDLTHPCIGCRGEVCNLEPDSRKDQRESTPAHGSSSEEVELDARKVSRRGRPPGSREAREILTAYLADFARECNDQAPLPSTVTRVYRLFEQAGVPKERYPDVLYLCRSIVQERSGQITKQVTTPSSAFTTKNKMPYYLAVLADQLGLKDEPDGLNLPQRTPNQNAHQSSSITNRLGVPASSSRSGYAP